MNWVSIAEKYKKAFDEAIFFYHNRQYPGIVFSKEEVIIEVDKDGYYIKLKADLNRRCFVRWFEIDYRWLYDFFESGTTEVFVN
ncbi:MAG: hypothetical protein A2V66_16740 [Ignavibacteria bacterium RBG_13_36_8]|nr:MAG: hypothetical protein A2V66_16740 [Ignavibacteria bacterium RBG_13_36_8]